VPTLEPFRMSEMEFRVVDAHGPYSQFGFRPLKSPERNMELHNPKVYESRKTK